MKHYVFGASVPTHIQKLLQQQNMSKIEAKLTALFGDFGPLFNSC